MQPLTEDHDEAVLGMESGTSPLHLAAASEAYGMLWKMLMLRLSALLQVKMVTSDDEATTDILCEGPEEEIERLRKEFGLAEKGKVLVKGLLER